ncbi:glycosyltransferase family 39 protein [Candidatus Roizmanbacteria bacterium]|nr:glycosyltransferase family 39 protein [Candidatus Roizmanbacteria bacterium]
MTVLFRIQQWRKTNQASLIILFFILTIGAILRLWRISEYMTFLGDEGRDVLIVKRFIVDHDIPFLGPTASVGGFFLGPIYYYFMTPFLWIFNLNPVGPAVMVALFGIATIALVYWTGKELFGTVTGFIASFLYALSPLTIAYSRSSWNPNIVPFFAILYIFSLWKATSQNTIRWYLVTGICIGTGLQLHYLFMFLIPVGFVYLLICRPPSFSRVSLVAIIAGAMMMLLPFVGFEIKNRFPNTRTVIQFLTAGKEVAYTGKEGMVLSDIVFRLFGRLVFYSPPPEQYGRFDQTLLWWWNSAVVITLAGSFFLLLYHLYYTRNKQYLLVFLWVVFGIGLFSFYQRAIYDYYLAILFPFPFLMTGWLLQQIGKKKLLIPLAVVATAGLVLLNWSGRPFLSAPNRQLAQVRSAAEFVFREAAGKPFNFALITSSNSDHGYRYFLEIWGNPPVTIENFDNDPGRSTVTDQLLIICEVPSCKPLGHSLWEIAGFGQAEIVGEWEVGVLKVLKLVHYQG